MVKALEMLRRVLARPRALHDEMPTRVAWFPSPPQHLQRASTPKNNRCCATVQLSSYFVGTNIFAACAAESKSAKRSFKNFTRVINGSLMIGATTSLSCM